MQKNDLGRKRHPLRSIGAASLGCLCSVGVSLAQEAPPRTTTSTEHLEEIVVTALRREQGVQDVPISISALTGDRIERMGADDLEDFAAQVPGLELTSARPGLNRISMRGISATTGESTVGFYIDELPVTADLFGQPDVKMFDVQRVEVLRGPQGTLFGEASLGGTIRIITNKPDPTRYSGKLESTLSRTESGGDNYALSGMFNAPVITDKLAVRVAGTYRDFGGWMDNTLLGVHDTNDEESYSVRAAARLLATDALSVTATFIRSKNDVGAAFISNERHEQFNGLLEPRHDSSNQYNLTVEYGFAGADLISSSSYYERDTFRLIDYKWLSPLLEPALGLPAGFLQRSGSNYELDYKMFVQELRLVSHGEGALQWVVGAFYKDTDRDRYQSSFSTPALPFPILGQTSTYDVVDLHSSEQWAVFGEATYDVTERLHVLAGVRYFEDKQDDSADIVGLLQLFQGGLVDLHEAASNREITPRFSVFYDLTDAALIYATAAKGFRAGGVNTQASMFENAPNGYDPESLWNYEVGAKTSWAQGRLTANGALYYIDWSDRQETISRGNPFFTYTDNVGKASSKGVELEIAAQPFTGLTLTAGGNYTDAVLEEATETAPAGNRLPFVPKYKVSFSGEYRWPLWANYFGVVYADYQKVGDSFEDIGNQPNMELAAYDLVNFKIGIDHDLWGVELFIDNATDEFVEYGRFLDPLLPEQRLSPTNRPRTYGLTARVRF